MIDRCASGVCRLTATAPIAARAGRTMTGIFANGDVRLSYRLDVPPATAPRPPWCSGTARDGRPRSRAGSSPTASCSAASRRSASTSAASAHRRVSIPASVRPTASACSTTCRRHGRRRRAPAARCSAIDGARIGLPVSARRAGSSRWPPRGRTPPFMVVLSGPTVSVGEEIFYSNIVEFSAGRCRRLPAVAGVRGRSRLRSTAGARCVERSRACGCWARRIAAFRRRLRKHPR